MLVECFVTCPKCEVVDKIFLTEIETIWDCPNCKEENKTIVIK